MSKDINNEVIELKKELSYVRAELEQISEERDEYLYKLQEIQRSKTYKIAHALTAVPRRMRELFYLYGKLPPYQKMYPYMISVVIAVYNTGDYLLEMLKSIENQKSDRLLSSLRSHPKAWNRSVVYERLFEVILVDDGSEKYTADLCDEYAGRFSWIKVLHKEHCGVAASRNAGIEIASGRYITFPDSDDILQSNVFEDCMMFFEQHADISLVTYPLHFFDAEYYPHWTTYRFDNGNRTLDLLKEWDSPQYFTSSSFFRTEDIKGKIKFDTKITNGEDIKFVHEVLFLYGSTIGLVNTCQYFYRRRSEKNLSVIQNSKMTVEYYSFYIENVLGWLITEALHVYGYIPKYIQYAVMGQLQWRLHFDHDEEFAKNVIGQEGFKTYRENIIILLNSIDSDVIIAMNEMTKECKEWALRYARS